MGFRATRTLQDYYDDGVDGLEMVRGELTGYWQYEGIQLRWMTSAGIVL